MRSVATLLSGLAGLLAVSGVSLAQAEPRPSTEFSSAYAPPSAAGEPGVNEGGIRIDLTLRAMSDYVYRGIDYSEFEGASEDTLNGQVDFKLELDLGKAPHPFMGVFTNVCPEDPVSRVEEIRPQLGVIWTVRPVRMTVANVTYIRPDREDQESSEVFSMFEVDDAYFLKTDEPLLGPYLIAAYDYDLYSGWYLEAGVRHDRPLGESGIVLQLRAAVAYVIGNELYAVNPADNDDTGFQHYELGLTASYDLTEGLGVSRRWGSWAIEGYLVYTDGIDNNLLATTQIWGGVGLRLVY